MSFFDDFLGITDPVAGLLFGGGGGGGGNPSSDIYAQYTNNANVPTNPQDVPFPSREAASQYIQLANQLRGIQNFLPYYTDAVTGQLKKVANAELASSRETSPAYAQLMLELYKQFGPQLNQVGSDIALQNALNQAKQDQAVLSGPGADVVKQAYGLSQVYDKPYYDTRAATAGRIGDLLSSIDLTGGLSPTERREIEQSLALQGSRRGTYNAPSTTETVGNAMQYGEAGRNRVLQNQDQLTKAIAASSAFLPAAKSGVDVFQVATGRPSMPNTGESKFTGVNDSTNAANTASGFANTLSGTTNNVANNANAFQMQQAQIDANKKDWLDQFVQFTQGLSNIGSVAGSVAGFCWIAREVYGESNPRWILFRNWLATKAPMWFFKWYVRNGEQFAKWLHNKPALKFIIRMWMDRRIKS